MNDLHQYLVDEVVEDYSEGTVSRRRALVMLGALVGSVAAAELLSSCVATRAAKVPEPQTKPQTNPSKTSPLSVRSDDPTISSETVELTSAGSKISGYFAHPSADSSVKRPIVLVCSENRGLTSHIQDVTRRLARAGYCAVTVDLVSREGGTAKLDPDAIPGILGTAPPERHVQDFQAALDFAKKQSYARPTDPGMIGFCFGGGITWRVAVAIPELRAAVPFYGPPPELSEVAKVRAAVLAIYAGNDTRINASIRGIEGTMKKSGKTFEKIIYPGVDHAFYNDSGARYNEAASLQAWQKTLAWLNTYLKPGPTHS